MTTFSCTLADWLERGPRLGQEHPTLATVMLTDRQPALGGVTGSRSWWCADALAVNGDLTGAATLPASIFNRLGPGRFATFASVRYLSDDEARADLCRAAIAWAKGVAGQEVVES